MLRWELRKSINVITVLTAAILCAVWFFVCRMIFVGRYEDINGAIYKNYIAELSELTFEEQSEFIKTENAKIGNTLSSETKMREQYFDGELSDAEYSDYLDLLENCKLNEKTFAYIKRKFERVCEDPRLKFTYDLELEGHLTTMTADFPLIVMLLIVGCFMFIPEIATEPFIKTCKYGRQKTFMAKLGAYFIVCGILIVAFNFAELVALFLKDLGNLTAPAASMEAFGELDRSVTNSALIVRIFLFRLLGEVTACAIFFALSSLCANHITYFCLALSLVMIPAFFVDLIPRFLRGSIVYYALSAEMILIDGTEAAVLVGSVVWIIASVIACKAARQR